MGRFVNKFCLTRSRAGRKEINVGGTEHDTKELGYFLVWKKTVLAGGGGGGDGREILIWF